MPSIPAELDGDIGNETVVFRLIQRLKLLGLVGSYQRRNISLDENGVGDCSGLEASASREPVVFSLQ
jgi:hypothetical protein